MTVEEYFGETEILDDAFVFEDSKDDIFQDAATLQYLKPRTSQRFLMQNVLEAINEPRITL